jgi:hypothetical protein
MDRGKPIVAPAKCRIYDFWPYRKWALMGET